MSVTPSSATVGVFRDRAAAEQALDALYNAGFTHEQVRYSVPETSGGFFDDLKSLFTGQNASGSVANDLADLGLSDEEANYYANEHSEGNIILAVKAPGRSAEVQTILQQYGSLNTQSSSDSLQDTAQHTTYTSDSNSEPIVTSNDTIDQAATPITQDTSSQSLTQTVPPEHEIDQQELQPMTTNYNDEAQQADQPIITNGSVEQHDVQSFVEQDTPATTHDNVPEVHAEQAYDSQETQPVVIDGSLPQDTSSPTSSTLDETTTPSNTEQQPLADTSDVQPTTTEYATSDEPQATSDVQIESQTASDATTEEPQATDDSYTAESEAAHIPDIQTAQPVATTTNYTAEPNDTQLSDAQLAESKVPTEPLINSTTTDEPLTTDTTAQQPDTGTTNNTNELQSLQAQIASLQQQLQDAKAQLQAAKEREEQVRTAREREQQLQTLRQQLEALQAELAATHSELQDTQSRLGQY